MNISVTDEPLPLVDVDRSLLAVDEPGQLGHGLLHSAHRQANHLDGQSEPVQRAAHQAVDVQPGNGRAGVHVEVGQHRQPGQVDDQQAGQGAVSQSIFFAAVMSLELIRLAQRIVAKKKKHIFYLGESGLGGRAKNQDCLK